MMDMSSITYCTERPVNMLGVIRENSIVIFPFSQPLSTTVMHMMVPIVTMTGIDVAKAAIMPATGWPANK